MDVVLCCDIILNSFYCLLDCLHRVIKFKIKMMSVCSSVYRDKTVHFGHCLQQPWLCSSLFRLSVTVLKLPGMLHVIRAKSAIQQKQNSPPDFKATKYSEYSVPHCVYPEEARPLSK